MPRKKKEEEEVYHVEVITQARINEDLEWEYYVKWGGYDSDANSWEPQENVQGCDRLLKSFWTHIGHDDKDYPIGYQVAAKDFWIQKEKKYFSETFAGEKLRRDESEKEAKRKNKEKQKPAKGKSVKQRKSVSDDSDASSDVPLSRTVGSLSQKRKKFVVDDSDSESDGPPLKQVRAQLSESASASIAGPSTDKGKQKAPPQQPSSPSSLFHASSPPRALPVPPRPSASIPAPPKPAPVRTHQDQLAKPLVKQIELPSRTIASGSALSTKQRIASGAPAPVTSKPKPKPPTLITKPSALAGLKMKKNKPSTGTPTDTRSADARTPTSAMAPPRPSASSAPGFSSTSRITDMPNVASPTSYHDHQGADVQMDLFGPDDPPAARDSPEPMLAAPAPPKTFAQVAADEFLKTMEFPGLNTPLEPPVGIEDVVEPSPPKAWAPPKPTGLQKIPKKWKWSGELFIDTTPDGPADRLCEIVMKDPSDPKDGARISLLVSSHNFLRVRRLYSISQLYSILRACGEAKQFAKLGPAGKQDEEAVAVLARHMTSKRQVALIPLSLDGSEIAVLLVFPATSEGLCTYLKVPQHMRGDEPLLVALIPWRVSSTKCAKHEVQRPLSQVLGELSSSKPITKLEERAETRLLKKRSLARAMKLLGFPKSILDFIASGSRPYCIWSSPADGSLKNPGLETGLLKFILGKTQATLVGPETLARVVFIHVGALDTINKLPMLAARRRDNPEILFYSYGSHQSVPCDRWGVRGIYPLGGIMTFTPSAILENPVRCHQLMVQAAEHLLWECYLLPSVLGLITTSILTQDVGDIPGLQEGNIYLTPILELVENGSLSVLWAPSESDSHHDHSPWLRWQLGAMSMGSGELASECVKAAASQYSNVPVSQILAATEAEISKDLCRMQVQPAIADSYRRFVVIKAESDSHISWDRDELEWCSVSKFEFKDDFKFDLPG